MVAWIITVHAILYPVEYPTVIDCGAAVVQYRRDAEVLRAICLDKGVDPKSVNWGDYDGR